MKNKIFIAGWLKNSFIDYPGTISSVIFLKGCNLRCPYCHNPSLVIPSNPINNINIEEIVTYITKRKNIITGIVISGGEPSIYEHIQELVCYLKNKIDSIKIKIDTNGLNPDTIKKLNIDYYALDVKAHPRDYKLLGCKLETEEIEEKLLESIEIAKSFKENGEIRITAVKPFISDSTIEYFKKILKGVCKIYLQPFINKNDILNPFAPISPVSKEDLWRYKKTLKEISNICEIRQ